MKQLFVFFLWISLTSWTFAQELTISSNEVLEWKYASEKQYQDPFNDVEIYAEIKYPDGSIFVLPGFWAGGNVWKFRFSSSKPGEYDFVTRCNDTRNMSLHRKKGMIRVAALYC